mmetsp:Transcript_2681/g.9639  ORF Transcript_2681/g.9639 Transcript_2681/m.9639 type:complete len:276 (+) Transcript_2681:1794-2621(+)
MTAAFSAASLRMRDVWAHNLDEECALVREVVRKYPYIAMDTEFPGVVARPVGSFKHQAEFHYQTLRCNVDMLKLIQLGLTFTDAAGNLPLVDGHYCIWQFNFKEFNLKDELYAQDSIELLKQSGIDFPLLAERGIDVVQFSERLMVSGVVLNEDIRWLTFHSGYDFGYLLKLLTNSPLPDTEAEFFNLLHCYFPCIFDIKHLMQFVSNMHGGLNKLAEHLGVSRIGPQHQAGSDSLLTAHTFFKLQRSHFSSTDMSQFAGVLHGFGHEKDSSVDN